MPCKIIKKGKFKLSKGINTSNNSGKIVFVIVILICVALLVVWFFIDMVDFAMNAETVSGTVSSVSERIETRGKRSSTIKTVCVDYIYDGAEYKSISLQGDLNDVFYKGKELTVYVDPDNARRVKSDRFSFLSFLFIVIFLAIIIFLLKVLFSSLSGIMSGGDKKRKKYIENGSLIIATVEDVIVNNGIQMDGKSLCYVRCSYKPEYSQIIRFFESHKMWSDCNMNTQTGDSVNVYILNNDYNDYYVDIEALQELAVNDYARV